MRNKWEEIVANTIIVPELEVRNLLHKISVVGSSRFMYLEIWPAVMSVLRVTQLFQSQAACDTAAAQRSFVWVRELGSTCANEYLRAELCCDGFVQLEKQECLSLVGSICPSEHWLPQMNPVCLFPPVCIISRMEGLQVG